MSSISSSDRTRQGDELRQAREERQNAEIETAKRNKAEKKRMADRHEEEVKRLREEYDTQMATLRNKHKSTLTDRDQEHQGQMDKIKGMYVEQMRRKTEDSEAIRKEQARTYESEMKQFEKVSAQQKDNLSRGFRESILERDKEFEDFQSQAQKTIRDSIDDRNQKLNERHQRDLNVVVGEREDKVAAMAKDKAEVQNALKRELNSTKEKSRSDLGRTNEHWMTVTKDREKMQDALLTNRNELLQAERKTMIEKLGDANQRKMEQLESAHADLSESVRRRQDGQVRALSHDLVQSKNDRVVDMITNRRLRDLEKSHLEEQQYARLQDLDRERSMILGVAKERTAEKMDDVTRRADKIVQETNRSNRVKQNIQGLQAKEDRAQLEFEMKNKVEHVNEQADKRLRRIVNVTNETTQNQQKFHEQSLEQIKGNYADNLAVQREVQLESIQNVRLRAEERLREQDVKAAKKLEETVANYEARLNKLQEEHKHEKNRMQQMYENRMTQREKGFKSEQETQAIKYEAKLAQADELRSKEVERIERRNQEQMANLANRMKYFEKKA